MTEPALTATVDGATLLRPLVAQWDTALQMLFDRLDGLTDDEYRWAPSSGAADLVPAPDGTLRVGDSGGTTRTIAWTLGHLSDMCWARADYCDGDKSYPLQSQAFPASAAAALDETRRAAARWRAAVAGASDEQATQVGYSSWPDGYDPDLPFVDIVWWMNRELIAHGSDAATVRDLYAARS